MKAKIWGTRGSIPVPGKNTLKYGGNTPCIEITEGDEQMLILDAGTGIRELGKCIINGKRHLKKINILISHTHYDHIQGLPFFSPFYDKNYEINIYSWVDKNSKVEDIIDFQMQPFFFPVKRDVFQAAVNFHTIKENETINIDNIRIQTAEVNHSRGTLSFKLSNLNNNKAFVYMTDNEIRFSDLSGNPEDNQISLLNEEVIGFCRGADYLIHDCMYTEKNFSDKQGWGHSNNRALAYFAMIADVRNLILFHYEPDYSDSLIDEMLSETREIISANKKTINCEAGYEGLEFNC